jgi:acetyl esterase/lipase
VSCPNEALQLLEAFSVPEADTADPVKVITDLRLYGKSQHTPADPTSGVLERDIFFTARDGFGLRAHVFEPADDKTYNKTRPLVVFIHGGGWTIGAPEDTANYCRRLVQKLGVTCAAPSYRQGPEDPFPCSVNDTWDGLQWIAAHAESELKGVSLKQGFVVGGSSAGANMTAVVSHLARDEGLAHRITGLFLLAPMILPPETKNVSLPDKYKQVYLSRTQAECQKDPFLSPALAKIFDDSVKADLQSHLFVPYIWPTGHKNLPRTYIQVCGMDILRDEALIYEQVLREDNGVETKLDIYPGMPHIFWSTFPM